jgi:hypothetical protein
MVMYGIHVVNTLDWKRLDMLRFEKMSANQQRVERLVATTHAGRFEGEDVFEKIRWWNDTFSVSFLEYRAKLKEIALKNWKATGAAISESGFADGTVSIPLDDDDWVPPNICDLLTVHHEHGKRSWWRTVVGGCWFKGGRFGRQKTIMNTPKGRRKTGNSAVTVGSDKGDKFIEEIVTYLPKTPASIMNLIKVSSKQEMAELFDYYMSADRDMTEETQWAEPYLLELEKFDNSITTKLSLLS